MAILKLAAWQDVNSAKSLDPRTARQAILVQMNSCQTLQPFAALIILAISSRHNLMDEMTAPNILGYNLSLETVFLYLSIYSRNPSPEAIIDYILVKSIDAQKQNVLL